MKKPSLFAAASAIIVVTILAVPAPMLAAPLLPGGMLYPVPGEPDPVGGEVIAGAVAVPLVAATFSGSATTMVIAGDASNPLGGLTFTYQVTNHPGSANVITQLGLVGFAGLMVDASYQVPGEGRPPASISLSSTGDGIFFTFLAGIGPGALDPGSSSAVLVLQTNASNYCRTKLSAIDGSVGEAASYAPAVAADFDHSGLVDSTDFEIFDACATGPGVPYRPGHLPPDCILTPDAQDKIAADFDADGDVDQSDFGLFQQYLNAPQAPEPSDRPE
ncbi:MAG TPA: hypothetical protein PLL20_11535 [Phycisphaerae bacterium]|nr:hypothetical protein [Phycisphaerae bacterium]HRR86501.1 hypothetical protein [Phycisphaerae bacterium]